MKNNFEDLTENVPFVLLKNYLCRFNIYKMI